MQSRGISNRQVGETPIAIVDLETTGLTAGFDRVVEVAVVRSEPRCRPELVLDTLVNPRRPIAATEIHGITDEDVCDAPVFEQIAADLVRALSDCVIAAYNVYFDMRFLDYELNLAGVGHSPPHFCLMYMRPMLGLGPKCSLPIACQAHGIPHSAQHMASADAKASALLLEIYLGEIERRRVKTFEDLGQLRKYKFTNSFNSVPFDTSLAKHLPTGGPFKARSGEPAPIVPQPSRELLGAYWDALTTVLADLEATEDEVAYLQAEKRKLRLSDEQVRVLHARAFASAISEFVTDQWLDQEESDKLRRLYLCLSRLGWAPGE